MSPTSPRASTRSRTTPDSPSRWKVADYAILSDPEKTVAKEYGVLGPRGFAQRWTFYIDKDGKIAAIDKKVNTKQAAPDVAAKLKELGIAGK